MTIACKLSEIADAISGISISGVTVLDRNQVVPAWPLTANVLYPKPDGLVSDIVPTYVSLSHDSGAQIDLTYTLTYRFLGVRVASDGTFQAVNYSDLIDKAILIVNAMIAVHAPYSGKVDMTFGGISNVGALTDPAGNLSYGCDITLNITEQQN